MFKVYFVYILELKLTALEFKQKIKAHFALEEVGKGVYEIGFQIQETFSLNFTRN